MTGLTGNIGDIGTHHETIEHRVTGLRHIEWQQGLKLTFIIGLGDTTIDLYPFLATTDHSSIPVTAVGPPPESGTAGDLVTDLRILHRHTGITHGHTFHSEGVACSIGLLDFREINMERRTLIFLYTDGVGLSVDTHREHTGKT